MPFLAGKIRINPGEGGGGKRLSFKSPTDVFDQLQFDLECDTRSWSGRNTYQTESLPPLFPFINKHTSNVRLLQKEVWSMNRQK